MEKEVNTMPALQGEVLPPIADHSMYFDTAKVAHVKELAQIFAKSQMVPQQYRGNIHDCFIALQISYRLGVDPFMFMQSSHVIHGKPGLEAKLMIALVNARGPFNGGIQFEYKGEGDKRQCTAYGLRKDTGLRCEATASIVLAKAEGWYGKNGSKWPNMPDQMLAYRSAAFLIRLYCPELILGLHTTEELRDIDDPDSQTSSKTQDLNKLLAGSEAAEPEQTPQEPKKKPRYLSQQDGFAG